MTILEMATEIITQRSETARIKLNKIYEILKNDESYRKIMDEIDEITGLDLPFEEIERLLNQKQLEVDALLRSKNIDFNVYYCNDCKDTGFKNNQPCSCFSKVYTELLYEQNDIPFPVLEKFEESDFSIFKDTERTKKIYSHFLEFSKGNYDKRIITLSGKTGTGKTHLAKCFAQKLMANNKIVLFLTAFHLSQLLRDFTNPQKHNTINLLRKCDYLFIDDFGSESKSDYYLSQLFSLISERYEYDKRTIITTNYGLAEIQKFYSERLFSRISEKKYSVFIEMKGKDLRLTR